MAHSGIYFTSSASWKLSEEREIAVLSTKICSESLSVNFTRVVWRRLRRTYGETDTRGRRASLRLKEQEKWAHHSSNGGAQTTQLFSTTTTLKIYTLTN